MKSLDDQIADIERLDKLRQRARELQQEAFQAITGGEYNPQKRRAVPTRRKRPLRNGWNDPGDDDEKALVLRALAKIDKATKIDGKDEAKDQRHKIRLKTSRDAIIKDLKSLTRKQCETTKGPHSEDRAPFFRCATVLEALAETSEAALPKALFYCLYVVVRELHEVGAPTWVAGGARAGKKARASAFVTGASTRALLALRTAFEATAEAATLLEKAASSEPALPGFEELAIWRKEENKFRKRALNISLQALQPRLLVKLDGKAKTARELLNSLATKLRRAPEFDDLKLSIPTLAAADTAEQNFTSAAEMIACNAVANILAPFRAIPDAGSDEALGRAIADELNKAVSIIDDLLKPAERFATSVIERQLAAPHIGLRVDSAELVFAAVLLGRVAGWTHPKLKPAFELVRRDLNADGRLLSIQPFDVLGGGYRLNVQTLEVTRQLASLAAKLEIEIEPEFVQRLMAPFEDTRGHAEVDDTPGWTSDPPRGRADSDWWVTGLAIDAIDWVARMLDAQINRQILHHFTVRQPGDLKLDLDVLFYPDFAIAAWLQSEKKDGENIAVKLQRLRAHAAEGPIQPKGEQLYSIVLFGPPGTGKTTLVEAVAKSAGVPLVEVTPSDILVGGAEGVERRARHVFQALSMLTHAVILFDEFDSIFQKRQEKEPDEPVASVFEFLTPGMLPKLKLLHDRAEKQRVSYVLATNLVSRIDPAIQRGGRFDDKHGIYPPDVVSRVGRLLDQVRKLSNADRARAMSDLTRIWTAVNATRNGPMDKIGREGWYTAPRGEIPKNAKNLFGFLVEGGLRPKVEAEAKFPTTDDFTAKELREIENAMGPRYWSEWGKVNDWDREFESWSESDGTAKTESSAFLFLEGLVKKKKRRRTKAARPRKKR